MRPIDPRMACERPGKSPWLELIGPDYMSWPPTAAEADPHAKLTYND